MAVAAAQAGDTAQLVESLTRLAGLGAGAGVIDDGAVIRMSTVPGVAGALQRLRDAT